MGLFKGVFLMSRSTASSMLYVDENKGFNAEWKIENFSLFRLAGRKPLRSPVFNTNTGGVIRWWRLLVYYSNLNVEFKLVIYKGEEIYDDLLEISLLSNGVLSNVQLPRSSEEPESKIFTFSIKTSEIFVFKRNSLLPQDTLTVCFRVLRGNIILGSFLFRTVLQTINFSWLIENFNFANQAYRTVCQQDSLQLIMILIKGYKKGTHAIRIETQPGIADFPYLAKCELSIEDGRGYCLSEDSIYPTTGWLFFLDLEGTNYEDLTLEMKCLVATDIRHQPESTKFLTPVSDAAITAGDSVAHSLTSSTLKQDLLSLYKEGIDSDVTIKTEDSSFPVHKTILSARSKVFQAMFQTDNTSEYLSGIVNIKDIDSQTVERMLIFMYGDTLEDMQWEDALDLYYAADKYAIHSLKLRCADILKAGVTVSNVCQLLVLADNHSDEELIRIVVEFIHEHDEVISLAEWVELEDSCPKLTMKIMRELYLMQRGAKPKRTIA